MWVTQQDEYAAGIPKVTLHSDIHMVLLADQCRRKEVKP
jgi:hypothetical protein